MMTMKRIAAAAALILGACLLAAPARPQTSAATALDGLAVTPTIILIQAGRASAALEVRNRSDAAIAVQLSAYRWTQEAGEEQLTDDPAMLVSPPITTIPAGGAQTFRIMVPKGPRTVEGSWRVVLDELPRAADQGTLGVRLRLSMPVFAAADTDIESGKAIDWRVEDGRLIAANNGSRHVRIASLLLDGRTRLPPGPSPYLLSGARRSWPLPHPALRLTGMTDRGPIDAPLQRLAAQ